MRIVVGTVSEWMAALQDGRIDRNTEVGCSHCPWLGAAVMFPTHLLVCPDQTPTRPATSGSLTELAQSSDLRILHQYSATPMPRSGLELGVSSFLGEKTMIILGLILLIVGYLLPIPILATLGWVLFIIGLVLWALGAFGHPVGGRNRWW